MEEDGEETRENRFAYLLQPIRDLGGNWDIDIAKELEDYLEELEHIQFRFDDEELGAVGKTLNFAEAALLIQGSANVYSKKVEYLYSLLFQTLDLLAQKRKKMAEAKGVEDSLNEDEEPEFLPLDDNLEVSQNIDLTEKDEEDLVRKKKKTLAASKAIVLRGSLMELIQPEDQKGKEPGMKMNECFVNRSGAMLLEEDFELDRSMLDARGLTRATSAAQQTTESAQQQSEGTLSRMLNGTALHDEPTVNLGDAALANNNDNGDDDNHLGPHDLGGDDAENDRAGGAEGDANELRRSSRQSSAQKQQTDSLNSSAAEIDPWLCLDVHAPTTGASNRPFRRKATWKLPACLTGKEEKKSEKESEKLLPISFRLPHFPDLEYIYVDQIKKRQSNRRKQRGGKASRKQTAAAVSGLQNLSLQQTLLLEREDEQNLQNDTGIIGLYGDAGADDDSDNEGGLPPAPEPFSAGEQNGQSSSSSASTAAPLSYEQMAKKQIDEYMALAGQFAQESALAARVNEWNQKLEPLLNEQESRPAFDVQQYGMQLLDHLPKSSPTSANPSVGSKPMAMKDLLRETSQQKPQHYEACRLFVTALHLINNGNVDLITEGREVKLKFLSDKPLNENIGNFEPEEAHPSKERSSKSSKKADKTQKKASAKGAKKKATRFADEQPEANKEDEAEPREVPNKENDAPKEDESDEPLIPKRLKLLAEQKAAAAEKEKEKEKESQKRKGKKTTKETTAAVAADEADDSASPVKALSKKVRLMAVN